jgi:hypothetical protein
LWIPKEIKDEANKEFAKIEGQVEDRIMLVTIGDKEFLVLHTAFDTHNTKVRGLRFENNPTKDVIRFALVELGSLQQKNELSNKPNSSVQGIVKKKVN